MSTAAVLFLAFVRRYRFMCSENSGHTCMELVNWKRGNYVKKKKKTNKKKLASFGFTGSI